MRAKNGSTLSVAVVAAAVVVETAAVPAVAEAESAGSMDLQET